MDIDIVWYWTAMGTRELLHELRNIIMPWPNGANLWDRARKCCDFDLLKSVKCQHCENTLIHFVHQVGLCNLKGHAAFIGIGYCLNLFDISFLFLFKNNKIQQATCCILFLLRLWSATLTYCTRFHQVPPGSTGFHQHKRLESLLTIRQSMSILLWLL